ncbi:MAG: DUF4153 domain-containing protein [Treponema sp.]|nr:DUF4153 domain-containing protein [Treponema sp.]
MKIFKNFFKAIKPAAARFPAVFVFCVVAAVFVTLESSSYEIFSTSGLDYNSGEYKAIVEKREAFQKNALDFCKAAAWTVTFAFFAGIAAPLAAKKFGEKRKKLFAIGGQALSAALFFVAYALFKGESAYRLLAYFGTEAAIMFLAVFLLMFEQEEKLVAPNIIVSGMISGIAAGCVCAGLFIIRFAVDNLLFKLTGLVQIVVDSSIISFSWLVCCACIFVAYATKPKEEISVPKAFKVIFMFILLPLYLILLFVLYAYIAKSLFTLSLPNGRINWFVSFASVFYLVFFFSIRQFESKAVQLYCKWGAALLIPLIVTQCVAFGIRINAYGYTEARYASLLYILFSVACVAISFIKKGKYMSAAFPLFAALCLFASVTPMNLLDVPFKNQTARIEKLFKSAGLFNQDGTLDAQSSEQKLSEEQKAQVVSSYNEIIKSDSKIKKALWLLKDGGKYDFKKSFGFAFSNDYGKGLGQKKYYFYGFGEDYAVPFDVSEYSQLYAFKTIDDKNQKAFVHWGDNKQTDITNEIKALLKEMPQDEYNAAYEKHIAKSKGKPLAIKIDGGWTIVLTYLNARQRLEDDSKNNYWSVDGRGYVCK